MAKKVSTQLDLFPHVAAVYAAASERVVDNAALYRAVARQAGVPRAQLDATVAIGRAGAERSPIKRAIRWHQQTLRQLGVIERVDGQRGLWQLRDSASKKLHQAAAGVRLVAFSTDLGVAIWARSQSVFPALGEPISLCVTSPPYPLRAARAYGNPTEREFVDFLCVVLEPIVRALDSVKQDGRSSDNHFGRLAGMIVGEC